MIPKETEEQLAQLIAAAREEGVADECLAEWLTDVVEALNEGLS